MGWARLRPRPVSSLSASRFLSLLGQVRSETIALTWQYPYKIRVISCPVNSAERDERLSRLFSWPSVVVPPDGARPPRRICLFGPHCQIELHSIKELGRRALSEPERDSEVFAVTAANRWQMDGESIPVCTPFQTGRRANSRVSASCQ